MKYEFSKTYDKLEEAKDEATRFLWEWRYGYDARAVVNKDGDLWKVDFSRYDSCD